MIDHFAGLQKNPWAIEYGRLSGLINAATSVEERDSCAIIATPGSSQWSANACWKCRRNGTR